MGRKMAVQIPDTLISALLQGEKFLIFTHVRPDGDAIGSAFGMCSFLRGLGKTADVVLPVDPPARYLKLGLQFLREASPENYDTFVALDCASFERIADAGILSRLTDKSRFFNLDHHFTNNVTCAGFAFVDAKASSACEIAASLAFASGRNVSCQTAEFFLTGMMTDTGGFKFSNTNGEVLRMAAKLLDAGANLEKLVNILFFSKPEKQLRFESELVSRQIKIACSGKFAYAFIPQELLDKYNFSLKEDEGIIDILREIDGVVIAMLVHHQPEGFKISLRSKEPRCPVAPIASAFGGGGHLMAAGATADLPDFESLEKIMLEKVSAALAVLEENI